MGTGTPPTLADGRGRPGRCGSPGSSRVSAALSGHPARLSAWLALLVTVTLLSGCAAYTRDLQPPQVALAAIEVAELGLRAQRFRVTLELDNPNDVALPVQRLDYALELAGESLAEGHTESRFRVPPGGRERITLLVSTDMLRSADQMLRILDQGAVGPLDYHVYGRVRLDLPLSPSLRFSERGEVPLVR